MGPFLAWWQLFLLMGRAKSARKEVMNWKIDKRRTVGVIG